MTGEVRLHLEPGSLPGDRAGAPARLYDYSLATYDAADAFRHEDSAGFVRLWGLSTDAGRRSRAGASVTADDHALARAVRGRALAASCSPSPRA